METPTAPFPKEAQNFLDALYAAHPSKPKTDRDKIALLEELSGAQIDDHFEEEAGLRKAYEFVYLTNQGILKE